MKLPTMGKNTLTFALLIAAFTAGFNWLIEKSKANSAETNNIVAERRQYLKAELSEFYYPIYLRLLEDDTFWKDEHIWNELGGSKKSLPDRFGGDFEKTVILSNHEAIVDLINKHMYYVRADDIELQEQLLLYVKHVAVYEALRKAGDNRTPAQVGIPWPGDFEKVLKSRLDGLQREYDKTLGIKAK